ncbi:MAG: hypothetical protein AB1422_01815 [bacterium]
MSNKEIGEIFGVSPTAIGKASIRVRNQMSDHKGFKKKVEDIVNSAFEI